MRYRELTDAQNLWQLQRLWQIYPSLLRSERGLCVAQSAAHSSTVYSPTWWECAWRACGVKRHILWKRDTVHQQNVCLVASGGFDSVTIKVILMWLSYIIHWISYPRCFFTPLLFWFFKKENSMNCAKSMDQALMSVIQNYDLTLNPINLAAFILSRELVIFQEQVYLIENAVFIFMFMIQIVSFCFSSTIKCINPILCQPSLSFCNWVFICVLLANPDNEGPNKLKQSSAGQRQYCAHGCAVKHAC